MQAVCPTGEIKLRTDRLPPLWMLAFVQVEDDQGGIDLNKIHILAGEKPPMNDTEKKKIWRRLDGTSDRDIQAVLKELKLDDREFPTLHVEQQIADKIKWDTDLKRWVRA